MGFGIAAFMKYPTIFLLLYPLCVFFQGKDDIKVNGRTTRFFPSTDTGVLKVY